MARPSPQTDRVVALVELLASRPHEGFSLAELTRRLGVNKSTCHSMLTTLSASGWLLRDPARKTYRLGPALVAVSRAASATFPALEFAHAAMVDLTVDLGVHCAALAVSGDHVNVLDEVRDRRARGAGLAVGAALPLRPPFGGVFMAWADHASVGAWLDHAPAHTHAGYCCALAAIRQRGFAVEITTRPEARLREMIDELRGTDEGLAMPEVLDRLADQLADRADALPPALDPSRSYAVSTVNAPVFDHDGRVALALSLVGFGQELNGRELEDVGARLVRATGELTAALHGVAPQHEGEYEGEAVR